MRILSALGVVAASLLPLPAAAGDSPVLVELFTSQGCSSCPPADKYLGEITKDENVLGLAFHVDYWDRLGWPDTFADSENTNRQYAYARHFSNRSVWTPQFVVNGRDYSKGNFRAMVAEYVTKAAARPDTVELSATIDGNMLMVAASPLAEDLPRMDVFVAHFTPEETVAVKRGENAGRTLTYHNVVTGLYPVGRWSGKNRGEVTVDLQGERPFVVFVQERKAGAIHAAMVIR